eukprot:357163-Chlamydomonas_euryale.AAC.4
MELPTLAGWQASTRCALRLTGSPPGAATSEPRRFLANSERRVLPRCLPAGLPRPLAAPREVPMTRPMAAKP